MASQASTAVATIPTEEGERFNLMQREARLFAASPLIPQHLRQGGPEQAMANCYIALKMARTMGEDPLVVLQNIHVVNGKAGFASQYMIARANSSGVFKGRINWVVDKSDPNNLAVTAFATLADTGDRVEFTVDMAMAIAEQWTKNPKYRTMPEVMLRYRSAAFLVRFYAPDVMLGYHTADEAEDVGFAGAPIIAEPLSGAMLIEQAAEVITEAGPETGELVEAEPAAEEPKASDQPEESPSDAKLREICEKVEAAATSAALKKVDGEWVNARGAYSDDVAAEIDALLAAKRNALKNAEG